MNKAVLNPFDLDQESAYKAWRDEKLKDYPKSLGDLVVEIKDPRNLSVAEYQEIHRLCRKANMAIWAGLSGHDSDKNIIRDLGSRFGLEHLDHNMCADEDAITSLTVQSDALHQGYIPYTTRPIAWHTDGYYNPLDHQIHGLLLHCVNPAAEGGENDLLDHEIVYLLIRDKNPDFIRALMHPKAMTIPANIAEGKELRPARSGPVFAVYPDGHLHMRYTDRTRSIEWGEIPLLDEAVDFLKQTLRTRTAWHYRGKLQAGQGLVSNNVLHTRSGFEDHGQQRLLYRARYFDRIKET
ncbi:MAG: TauD/TfdA family dioxygenase [gamma proteobacterium endosymbiont of Lamellibrachia anaximandri]|nr:TauD/TfdA family dioxygenase [gamma proteobacterium endosymbiont of Lamellibrachia anaximandri]